MKNKTIWIIVSIVILLAVLYWGSQTNWWGLKRSIAVPSSISTTVNNSGMPPLAISRNISNPILSRRANASQNECGGPIKCPPGQDCINGLCFAAS